MKPVKIQLQNKKMLENLLCAKKSIIIICFLIFILYTILIIYVSSLANNKKITIIYNQNPDSLSNLELLRLFTLNDKKLYEGAETCLIKNPDEEMCIYQFLCPKEVKGKTRIMLGNKKDGSYVMLNDFDNIKIAYSIGIYNLVQFDQALADKGIDVYMYDHTINKLPYENNKFHWKKIGLGSSSEKSENIQTLEDMMRENGHLQEKNMILKIDIEYNEWKPLNEISQNMLKQFKYIIIEFHFFKNELKLFYDVLKKLHKTHQIFFIRCGSQVITYGNNRICHVIETSYIIREGYTFLKDKSIYPIPEFFPDPFINFNMNIFKLFDSYTQ
jgi:hypothetical protein